MHTHSPDTRWRYNKQNSFFNHKELFSLFWLFQSFSWANKEMLKSQTLTSLSISLHFILATSDFSYYDIYFSPWHIQTFSQVLPWNGNLKFTFLFLRTDICYNLNVKLNLTGACYQLNPDPWSDTTSPQDGSSLSQTFITSTPVYHVHWYQF